MNAVNLNSASLNSKRLNVIGEIRSSVGTPSYANGVYIQHIDMKLYTQEEWVAKGFSNDDANGVAVITDILRVIIAKEVVKAKWASATMATISGIPFWTASNYVEDFAGESNTIAMLEKDVSGAGYLCYNYMFPNGQRGYLPAIGELNYIYTLGYWPDIYSAMLLIGETNIYGLVYWSSSQFSSTKAWCYSILWNSALGKPTTSLNASDKSTERSVLVFTRLQ